MKKIVVLIIVVFYACVVRGQDVEKLWPTYVYELDFSDKVKAEWALRDTLLSQLSDGRKDWEKMSEKEQTVLEKYGEVHEDMWDIIGGGCSWYCGGGPKEVSASSYLKSQGAINYKPENAHDLNYKYAWVEGVDGYGIGEYLLYTFEGTTPRINEIKVVNGYVKSNNAYRNNSRVKKFKVYIDEKPYAILNLKDKRSIQSFKVDPIGNSDRKNWDVLKTKPDWTLKFEILEVYKGLKYDDVVISEIYFDGIDVHCFAKGTKLLLADNSTKNIENIEVGELVSYMDFNTKKINTATVEKTEKVVHHGLVTYRFESGLLITATQDHPFKVANKGWASLKPEKSKQYKGYENISKIKVGDCFITTKGTDRLVSIEFVDGEQETYTISKLSAGDNFIANGLIVGVEEINE